KSGLRGARWTIGFRLVLLRQTGGEALVVRTGASLRRVLHRAVTHSRIGRRTPLRYRARQTIAYAGHLLAFPIGSYQLGYFRGMEDQRRYIRKDLRHRTPPLQPRREIPTTHSSIAWILLSACFGTC